MDTAPQQLVDEGRRWLETPFLHQGRLLGVGVDCAGVIIGAARACGVQVNDIAGYARQPDGKTLEAACDAHMARVAPDDWRPGDVLLMRFGRAPQHLAMVTQLDPLYILHAHGDIGRTVEHVLDARWRRRVVRAYRIPGVG